MSMQGGHPGGAPFPQQPGAGPGRPGGPPPAVKSTAKGRKGGRGRSKGAGGDQPVTKRVISKNRMFAIILAIVVAALLGLLLLTASPEPDTFVVRASRPMQAASPVQPSQLEAIRMDEAYIEPDAFQASSAEDAIDKALEFSEGLVLQYPVSQRQQITEAMFSAEASLGAPLLPDERLVSVRASAAATASGMLRPGDSVDVVLYNGDLAGMVASNVKIVGVTVGEQELSSAAGNQLSEENRDKEASELLPGQPIPGTFLLRVKMHQITPIVAADGDGSGSRLFLVLRGANAENFATVPMSVISAVCGRGLTPEDLGSAPAGSVVELPQACAAADNPGSILTGVPGEVPAEPEG